MTDQMITCDGYQLCVSRTDGQGTPILMLHGLGCSKELFADMIGYLDHPTIAVDLLGHGASDKPDTRDAYAMHHHAKLLNGLLDQLGIDDYILIGHSMGGTIGVLLAQQRPAVAVISMEAALIQEDTSLSARTVQMSYERFKNVSYPSLIQKAITHQSAARRRFAEMARQCPPWAWYACTISIVELLQEEPLIGAFSQLAHGMHIYGARTEHRRAIEHLEDMDVPTALIVDATHLLMLEQPHACARVVAQHLRSIQQ